MGMESRNRGWHPGAKRVHPHGLRHSFAQDLAMEGQPPPRHPAGAGAPARYLIQGIKRTLRRGTPPVDTITAFEVTPGARPLVMKTANYIY